MSKEPIQFPNIALSPTAREIMEALSPLLAKIDANFTELYDGTGLGTSVTHLFSDGTNDFRIQARDGALMFDQAITPTGFDGDENTDWKNLYEMKIEI